MLLYTFAPRGTLGIFVRLTRVGQVGCLSPVRNERATFLTVTPLLPKQVGSQPNVAATGQTRFFNQFNKLDCLLISSVVAKRSRSNDPNPTEDACS